MRALVEALDSVEKIAIETPAVENKASRFGNPAFRDFYDKVAEVLEFYRLRQDTVLTDHSQRLKSMHTFLGFLKTR